MSTAPETTDDDEAAIRLDGVSVHYRLPHEAGRNLKEYAIKRLLRRRIRYSEFWALRDLDLSVPRGESLGIVGHNGAGKSTLLKVIAGVLRPRIGRVRVRGRVAPLIELGTGFDSELTGRENVFLNGLMLGHGRRDVASRLDQIIDFAGLGEFIDAPLRTYSSGMLARLAFSIATDVDPEILLIDEILSAGDQDFQLKSEARIRAFHEKGGTSIVVSHALDSIEEMCQRTVWMDHGRVKMIGPTEDVLASYRT